MLIIMKESVTQDEAGTREKNGDCILAAWTGTLDGGGDRRARWHSLADYRKSTIERTDAPAGLKFLTLND